MGNYVTVTRKQMKNGTVCTVTIDNERKLNCLNSELLDELRLEIEVLKDDKNLAAVILTGAGDRAFIGGADITEMAELTPQTAREFITRIHELNVAIRTVSAPVIARVNGICLGAGMEIAAVCDIVIADENARFAMPEVHMGIPSVIEAAILPQILGSSLTRDLVLTGRALSAKEAHDARLVHRLASTGKLDDAVQLAVDQILKGGRKAVQLQKLLCNAWENENIPTSIQMGIDSFSSAYNSTEPTRMMGAFINRKR